MKATLILEDVTPDDLDRIRDFIAPYNPTVALADDDLWTTDRIHRYYLALPPRAQRILEEAVARGGYVDADTLRGDDGTSLKGHSAGLKRILDRGIREGWLPSTIEAPVQAQGPGFGKVVGYKVPEHLCDLFRQRLLTLPTNRRTTLSAEITHRGASIPWDAQLASEVLTTHGLDTDTKGARAILRHLADSGLIVKTHPDRAVYRLNTEQ